MSVGQTEKIFFFLVVGCIMPVSYICFIVTLPFTHASGVCAGGQAVDSCLWRDIPKSTSDEVI